ncbi:MAG: TlpA family protein disulfide reductase [Desulfobacterales bacterium]
MQSSAPGNPPERPQGVATDLAYGYQLISVGKEFPAIGLETPENQKDRKYLGIDADSEFALSDIEADLVLVEILNVYCVHCQDQAPIYNKLFEKINADASLNQQIKMIGVGAGNNQAETESFRKKYNMFYPLVPDPRLDLHQAIGSPRTPFSILVRLIKDPASAMAALTYSGVKHDYKEVFNDMQALKSLELSALRNRGDQQEARYTTVEPPYTQSEIEDRVKKAMTAAGDGDLTEFRMLSIDGRQVYAGISIKKEDKKRLFAEVISRPTLCDICHDVHFAYMFDQKGKVLDFIPLQVTKWGNKEWSKQDAELMRERLVGRFISGSFAFNPELDAVTSATITSAVIFEGMSEAEELFRRLKEKGLI